MFFDIFKKKDKKPVWPEEAQYKFHDFVYFRYKGEISFGYVWEAKMDEEGNVIYTIQIGGECPTFIYNNKEEQIVGKVQ